MPSAASSGQIVKSLVFVVDGRPVVALVAGDRRGDADAIAAQLVGRARGSRTPTRCAPRPATRSAACRRSTCPPDLPVLVDDSLERFDVVYPAAGTPTSMVRMVLADLIRLSGGRMARISH